MGKYTKGTKTKLSSNFSSNEFDCHGKNCCSETIVEQDLINYLQKIREHFNKPVHISSGYRCPVHNKNVNGATGSRHVKGMAADIYIDGIAPVEIAKYAESIGVLGIGLYETQKDGFFVHVDTRTTKSFWYGQAQERRTTFGAYEQPKKENNVPKVDLSPIDEKIMWEYFISCGLNEYGVAGLMGNLYAESGFIPTNLQNTYEKKLGLSDAEYTASVDSGEYSNFVNDKAGYGIAQWTYWSLKRDLLAYAKSKDTSIGDGKMQMEFLVQQLKKDYLAVWRILTSAKSVREASDAVLLKFERPADQSKAVQIARANYGQKYYNQFAKKEMVNPNNPVNPNQPEPPKAFKPYTVKVQASLLNYRSGPGTNYKINGTIKKNEIYGIVEEQNGNWGKLKSGAGWICLDYVKKI